MPDPMPPTSLPAEITAATRTHHTTLNRLITSRLPLALPPHGPTPALYTTGLLHFAHVFLTFESVWADLVPSPSNPPTSPLLSFLLVDPWETEAENASSPTIQTPPQMLQFLARVRPKGLARSGRLKRDLEFLTGMHGTDLSVLLARFPGPQVRAFCTQIRRETQRKPHILLAYAWCFYMAVFSGGRWIRDQLVAAGEEFWRANAKTKGDVSLAERGLSFWNFDGEEDGEDIKAEFKRRLEAAEELLTVQQREEVVTEAKQIFAHCAELVKELDEKFLTDMEVVKRLEGKRKRRPKEEKVKASHTIIGSDTVKQGVGAWFRRLEVHGAMFAVGLLAWAVFMNLDLAGVF